MGSQELISCIAPVLSMLIDSIGSSGYLIRMSKCEF